jgi:hypothetical protein
LIHQQQQQQQEEEESEEPEEGAAVVLLRAKASNPKSIRRIPNICGRGFRGGSDCGFSDGGVAFVVRHV